MIFMAALPIRAGALETFVPDQPAGCPSAHRSKPPFGIVGPAAARTEAPDSSNTIATVVPHTIRTSMSGLLYGSSD